MGCRTTGWSGIADDWCLVVSGTRADAEALRDEIAARSCAAMGLRLSQDKTLITHIDEGLDFLGWRIQRHRKRGTSRHYVYTYPARKALKAVTGQGEGTVPPEHRPAAGRPAAPLNPVLRGWCAYFRPGVSSATFHYLSSYAGARSSGGYGASTAGLPGRNCAAAPAAAGGGQPAQTGNCSTPPR